MTTIEFTNEFFKSVNDYQQQSLKNYNKLFKVDNILKKIEYYENNTLNSIEYYKATTENINNIFLQLNTNTLVIVEIQDINNVIVKSYSNYINGIIQSIEKRVLKNGKIICIQDYEINNVVILQSTEKYFYDNNGNDLGEELLSFTYNNNGSLQSVSGSDYPFSNHNQSLDADQFLIYFPTFLNDNAYYQNANLLP